MVEAEGTKIEALVLYHYCRWLLTNAHKLRNVRMAQALKQFFLLCNIL